MRQYYASKIERAKFFTDTEAWNLFRLAAFGEAFGWTLLIGSLIFKHYLTPTSNIPVEIAGQIHGTLFLIYIASVVVLHPSLKWSPKRTLIAGLVSVPPYGTLVFEQWAAHARHTEALAGYRQLVVRGLIVSKDKLLALQPKESGYWYLPGGIAAADELAEKALSRIITKQTGTKPVIGQLSYVWQHKVARVHQLELFFIITNAQDYRQIASSKATLKDTDWDEMGFITPSQHADLRPKFLQRADLPKPSSSRYSAVKFI